MWLHKSDGHLRGWSGHIGRGEVFSTKRLIDASVMPDLMNLIQAAEKMNDDVLLRRPWV